MQYAEKADSYFSHTREDAIELLPDKVDRVVEIGCGNGATLAAIRMRFNPSFTAGFDINLPAIEMAKKRLDFAECLDIEHAEIPDIIENMDVILCLDVLEHLRDPWSVVERLRERMAPRGVLIVSVPNVRHYSVSANLLFRGKWRLTDAGFLDRTHLRFFVRETAIELLETGGLEVETVKHVIWHFKDRVVNYLSFGAFENIIVCQYVIRSSNPG